MLPARKVDVRLRWAPAGTPPPLLAREECAAWQHRVEAVVDARGQHDRMLEVALAAMQYASEGVEPEEALQLASDLILR